MMKTLLASCLLLLAFKDCCCTNISSETVFASIGETVALPCMKNGTSANGIWQRGENVISEGLKINEDLFSHGKMQIRGNHRNGEYNLEISNVSAVDFDVYTCHIVSGSNIFRKVITLKMIEKKPVMTTLDVTTIKERTTIMPTSELTTLEETTRTTDNIISSSSSTIINKPIDVVTHDIQLILYAIIIIGIISILSLFATCGLCLRNKCQRPSNASNKPSTRQTPISVNLSNVHTNEVLHIEAMSNYDEIEENQIYHEILLDDPAIHIGDVHINENLTTVYVEPKEDNLTRENTTRTNALQCESTSENSKFHRNVDALRSSVKTINEYLSFSETDNVPNFVETTNKDGKINSLSSSDSEETCSPYLDVVANDPYEINLEPTEEDLHQYKMLHKTHSNDACFDRQIDIDCFLNDTYTVPPSINPITAVGSALYTDFANKT